MATVTIKMGDYATINRTADSFDEIAELEQFPWVSVDDINESINSSGKFTMQVGDTYITAIP